MYERILVAVDGSDLAMRALEHGLKLAELAGSEVTVVTVIEPTAIYGGGYAMASGVVMDPLPGLIEAQESGAKDALARAEKLAAERGLSIKTVTVEQSFAAEGIVSTAEKIKAELIVMGSHGRRGLDRLLIGSQTSNVLAHTTIPVLVTR
jgi:nucleotide-binding universal stress UspA family protein